jgi:hypothetical protein
MYRFLALTNVAIMYFNFSYYVRIRNELDSARIQRTNIEWETINREFDMEKRLMKQFTSDTSV